MMTVSLFAHGINSREWRGSLILMHAMDLMMRDSLIYFHGLSLNFEIDIPEVQFVESVIING